MDEEDPNVAARKKKLAQLEEKQLELNDKVKAVSRQVRNVLAPFEKKKKMLIARLKQLDVDIRGFENRIAAAYVVARRATLASHCAPAEGRVPRTGAPCGPLRDDDGAWSVPGTPRGRTRCT